MTTLDDAYNASTVTFGNHQIKAYWREGDGTSDGTLNADTPTDLSTQFNGDMTIAHSLADGLPDPVTVTGDSDASGILSAALNGREGLVLATSGVRAFETGGGSWDTGAAVTTVTAPIPAGATRDDILVAVILIDDSTASMVQTATDPAEQWEFVNNVQDAPLGVHVYIKRRWRSKTPQLTLMADKPVDFMSQTITLWARNPSGMALDYRLTHATLVPQSTAGPTMTISGATLDNKGYFLTFWGAASGNTWTAGAGLTQVGKQAANGLELMSAISTLSDAGWYSWSSSQAGANSVAIGVALALEPYERPRLDGRQYFSPFNQDSPVYGYDRDTAQVTAAIRTITSDGQTDTALFDGQMQGIDIQGRQASLNAVSKSRLDMNRSITLPMVGGLREGLTLDWVATYLMARGGSFPGTAPNKYSRYWAALYGSTHAHWDTPHGYNNAYYISTAVPNTRFGRKYPANVNGKYVTAMYAQQSATRCDEVQMNPLDHMHEFSTDDFPHLFEGGNTGPLMMDMMSVSNTKGRLQMWVRGDAVQSAPTYLPSADDFICKMVMYTSQPASVGGAFIEFVEVGIASNSRNPYIKMGNDAGGTTSVSFVLSGLPTDGNWHFVGWSWDFAAGSGNATMDGTVITATTWATNGNNIMTNHASTDLAGRLRGDQRGLHFYSHVPFSDVLLDFGEAYVPGQWGQHYPTPLAPGANTKIWASHVDMIALAEPTVVNAWDTFADVSKALLASYRCNEQDIIEWLNLFHWGETPQMTSSAVQDTSKNSADMDVVIDPSKTRNSITIQFPDTHVDSTPQPALLFRASIPLARGISYYTFSLDTPVVEFHGQLFQDPANAQWGIVNLTSSQITTPNLPKTNHYVTMNTADDGTGSVLDITRVKAEIFSWDSGSITIKFTNKTNATAYLANNGDQVPFMQILGFCVRSQDGYTTVSDPYSIAQRGTRGLDVSTNWLQVRDAATNVAAHMANNLSRQRAEVRVTVFGDPRRAPGQRVTVLDAEGTQIAGDWRVLSVTHNTDGPAYTQDLLLIPLDEVGVWDADRWDNCVWGA